MKKCCTIIVYAIVVTIAIISLVACSDEKNSENKVSKNEMGDISVTPEISETPVATITPTMTEVVTITPTIDITPTQAITLTPTPVPKKIFMYSTLELNVRKGSDVSTEIIGVLSYGEKVQVLEKLENGWFRIIYDTDKTGYAFGKYLSEVELIPHPTNTPTPTSKPVITNQITVQVTPSPIITVSPGPDEIKCHIEKDINLVNMGGTYTAHHMGTIQKHFNLLNELRGENELQELQLDPALTRFAEYRVAEMISFGFFSHYHPGHSDVACVDEESDLFLTEFTFLGENMVNLKSDQSLIEYYSYKDDELAEKLFDELYNSDDHRNNMLKKEYNKVGISMYMGDNYILLVQIFGTY